MEENKSGNSRDKMKDNQVIEHKGEENGQIKNNEVGDNQGENNKTKQKHPILIITTICVIAAAVIGAVIAYANINRYEKGILEVCATQQDSYVQLVLDQINLKSNRDDEEIIDDILKTMDASSGKYWAFSRNQSMIFVKDVLETNRYKGISADSYYDSRASVDFMNSLELNRIQHKIIDVDNKTYVVSGVLFRYSGEDYRLCLMTEKSVLLDNNTYLEIKVQMETLSVVILLALILVATIYAFVIRKLQYRLDERDADVRALSKGLSKVNERLADEDLHDTRNNVWKQKAIIPFIDKLIDRKVYPVTMARIECDDAGLRKKFLERAVYVLDRNVLRFEYGSCDIVLLGVGITEEQLEHSLNILADTGIVVQKVTLIDNSTDMKQLRDRYA